MRAAEAEHGRRVPEHLREVRERRDADSSADQQRARDVELESVTEWAEYVDRRSRLEAAESAGSPPQRLDEER
jgi:hypothetical protein